VYYNVTLKKKLTKIEKKILVAFPVCIDNAIYHLWHWKGCTIYSSTKANDVFKLFEPLSNFWNFEPPCHVTNILQP